MVVAVTTLEDYGMDEYTGCASEAYGVAGEASKNAFDPGRKISEFENATAVAHLAYEVASVTDAVVQRLCGTWPETANGLSSGSPTPSANGALAQLGADLASITDQLHRIRTAVRRIEAGLPNG